MRVLVVHNEYRSEMPSGENQVVAAEAEMLARAGIEVDFYSRSSDEIESFGPLQRATLPLRPIFSFEGCSRDPSPHPGDPARRSSPAQPVSADLAVGRTSREK